MRYNSSNFKLNSDSFVVKYQEAGPKSVKFTEEHEWIAFQRDDSVFLGITQYASEALGEATFVELPEVGDTVEVGESIGSVESVKSASKSTPQLPVKLSLSTKSWNQGHNSSTMIQWVTLGLLK